MAENRHGFTKVQNNPFPPCKCYDYLVKKKNDRYSLLGKRLNLQVDKKTERHHVMVKVGGGWSTLEDYLTRHVPDRFRIIDYRRSIHSNPPEIKDLYLGMTSRYRSLDQPKLFYYSLS